MATWASTSGVQPVVKEVTVSGPRAEVVLDLGQVFDDWVYCIRREDGWHVTIDGNAPCDGWDDPTTIVWE
jgi:hypothetical protein